MQYKRRTLLIVLVLIVGSVTMSRISSYAWSGTTPQQDTIRLENRINQIEQRLYSIETSLRNLEQQFRLASVNPGVNPHDLANYYTQVQALQRRVVEDECLMARLDERTLTPAARAARRRFTTAQEACRANFEMPLRLPDDR